MTPLLRWTEPIMSEPDLNRDQPAECRSCRAKDEVIGAQRTEIAEARAALPAAWYPAMSLPERIGYLVDARLGIAPQAPRPEDIPN